MLMTPYESHRLPFVCCKLRFGLSWLDMLSTPHECRVIIEDALTDRVFAERKLDHCSTSLLGLRRLFCLLSTVSVLGVPS